VRSSHIFTRKCIVSGREHRSKVAARRLKEISVRAKKGEAVRPIRVAWWKTDHPLDPLMRTCEYLSLSQYRRDGRGRRLGRRWVTLSDGPKKLSSTSPSMVSQYVLPELKSFYGCTSPWLIRISA
jgi:hypothetical protein